MPMVRPTLTNDLDKLDNDFVNGYQEGAAVFYVSYTNVKGDTEDLSFEDRALFSPLWKHEFDKFQEFLQQTPELQFLRGKKFFICDGNHRHIAWMSHIETYHANDPEWHISVDSIILETKGRLGEMMHVMHQVNKYVNIIFFF